MTKLIFINYRRSDRQEDAFRLYDKLRELFDTEVFIDQQSIHPGNKWSEHIKNKLSSADLLIAVIGPDWLTASDENGRRLDNENDWVRQEIEFAI